MMVILKVDKYNGSAKSPAHRRRKEGVAPSAERRKKTDKEAPTMIERENHPIVCLVGSTSPEWQEQYRKVNRELCLGGCVVVTVSLFKTDVDDIEKYRDLLESIHFQKMDMSDVVVLIHKGAIGKHTRMELDYCQAQSVYQSGHH